MSVEDTVKLINNSTKDKNSQFYILKTPAPFYFRIAEDGMAEILGFYDGINVQELTEEQLQEAEKIGFRIGNIMDAYRNNMLNIKQWIDISHSIAKSKGWWDTGRSDGEAIALMHSELSEALEAMRNDSGKEAIAEELADCCIRIFDYCGERDINLDSALREKTERNKLRPYRHGKKF